MASNMKRILRYVIVEVLLTVLQLATLSEGGVPKLHSFGFPEKVDLGGRVQMVCNLNKGSVPVSFSWSKDDRPILDGKHIEIGSWNDMSSYLMIHSIYAEDIGNYTCLATNRIGTDSFTANLVVSASDPPKIQPFVFPDNLEIGTQTRVTCGLQKGSLPVRFTWKKNGAALNPVPDKIRFLKDDGFVMLEIKHLDVGDVANYTCSVRNREGEDSFTSRLVVTELPVLHPIHVPKDVEINGTVQVFCNLKKGSLPVEFSWTKDGRHLLREPEIETSTLNERASLLVIKHVTTNDVGNYTCHVENLAGSAKTTASLVFRATMYRDVTILYICQKYNIGPRFPRKTEPNLKLRHWNRDFFLRALEVLCIADVVTSRQPMATERLSFARHLFFACSLFFRLLTVFSGEPPRIQPFTFPLEVELGAQTSVYCGLSKGTRPIDFTWKKNGRALKSVNGKIHILTPDGSTVLEIQRLDSSDIGNYTCIARNYFGEDVFTSSLLLEDSPKIQPFNFPSNLKLGTRVNMHCSLTRGSLPVDFTWKKNEEVLDVPKDMGHLFTHDTFSMLEISSLHASDIGNYSCIAKNYFGEDGYTAPLLVRAPPFWKEQPKDSEAVLGKTTSLHCGIGGYPKPVITWKKAYGTQSKDFLIIRSDYKKKTILDNGTLVISMVEGADEGVYTCGAENGVGEGIQATVRLSVHAPPIVTSIQMRSSAKRGETAVIECEISGEQPFLVSWAKDGTKLTMPSTRYESYEEASGKGVKATLLVSSVERGDQGNYVCNVKNDYGSGKDVTILAVQEPPESPLDVRVVSKNSRSARVTWGSPSSVSAPIKQFVMMYWKNSKVSGKLHEVMLSSTETSTLLRDLQPGSEYTVRLLAENEVGRGDPSDPVTFETKEEEPEAPPVDIEVEPVDSHTLQISWKPPPTDTWNGQLKGYHVGYKVEGLASQLSYETVIKTNLREEKTLLRNLLPSTRYSVSVNAFNNAGDGPPSEELVTSTLNGDPPQPPEVKVKNVSQTSVTVMWSPRIDTQGSVRQYVLEYEDSSQNKNELHAPGTIKEYCIEGLEPGQRYGVRVAAYNRFGRGDFSPSLVVITEGNGRKAQLYVSYQQRLTYVPPSEVSRDSRAGDAAYDVPWDFSNGGGTMGKERTNYMKLKQGQIYV
ncbi:cell adhesion molecule Dscam1-like isoform X3 [Tachypleus tridentatus]|uniref:cell adhesion molecule Dscam1-like isoform X3 n=1 Tax=Tachypleus tridentatus TaxID=6853 RepID=UPI003FD5D71D